MALQKYYNSLRGATVKRTSLQDYFNTLAERGRKRLYEKEVEGTGIDPALFTQLREREVQAKPIREELEYKKPSFIKEMFRPVGEFGIEMAKTVNRAISLPVQTAELGVLEIADPLFGKFGTPEQQAKIKEEKAKEKQRIIDTLKGESNIFVEYEERATEFLKARAGEKYGTPEYKPTATDVVAVTVMGAIPEIASWLILSIPVLKGYRKLKDVATYKKVGEVENLLPKGTKFVKGTENKVEVQLTDDLKVSYTPKNNTIKIKSYQKRVPSQKALPENKLAPETTDLVMSTRKATGMEMTAKLQGDDLIMKPTKPIKPTKLSAIDRVKQLEIDLINKTTTGYQQNARLKAIGFEYSSLKRKMKGEPTNIEKQTARKRLESNYVGKEVSVLGKKGKVVGTAFGKIRVEFPDGIKSISPEDIRKVKVSDKQVLDYLKEEATKQLESSVYGKEYKQFIKEEAVIPKKAVLKEPKIPELTYEPTVKTSGLAKSVKKKAIRDKLIYGFDKDFRNLPEYDKRIKPEDIEKAVDFVLNDTDNAIRVAMGEIKPPSGMLARDIFVQVIKYATEIKDVKLIAKLINRSKLIGESTLFGQELQALSELNPYDPFNILKSVKKVREKAIPKKKLTDEQKKMNREIKATKKSQEDLKNFIKSIEC